MKNAFDKGFTHLSGAYKSDFFTCYCHVKKKIMSW
jgi:hypothetical protein